MKNCIPPKLVILSGSALNTWLHFSAWYTHVYINQRDSSCYSIRLRATDRSSDHIIFFLILALLSPSFPTNTTLVTVDQNTDEIELQCTTGSDGNTYSYKWFRNGVMLPTQTNTLSILRNQLSSSFYCCEIFLNDTFNLHCTTVVFYGQFRLWSTPLQM